MKDSSFETVTTEQNMLPKELHIYRTDIVKQQQQKSG